MAWVSITTDEVKERISGPEFEAFQTWHLDDGQSDPIPGTISRVVSEVRGRVAACERNTLDDDATKIPDELHNAALSIIAWRLSTRFPGGNVLQDDSRRKDYEDAVQLLKDAANCELAVVQPESLSCQPSDQSNRAGQYGGCDYLEF